MTVSPHPAADLFPLMGSDELLQLAENIRAHGLLDPIALHEGLVLDGRNRLRACELVGVAPRFVESDLDGMTPVEYVVSLRRHLTIAQRAALALDLLPRLEAEAKERQGARTDIRPEAGGSSEPGKATEQAASLVGVGRSTVERAKAIAKRAPDVVERMRSGEIATVAEAAREVGFDALAQSSPPIEKDEATIYYGKGDKFREATEPLVRYLSSWERRGYEFRHINPRQAQKRLAVIDDLLRGLSAAQADLEPRAHRARLTA